MRRQPEPDPPGRQDRVLTGLLRRDTRTGATARCRIPDGRRGPPRGGRRPVFGVSHPTRCASSRPSAPRACAERGPGALSTRSVGWAAASVC
ncbi:hypothetical protein ACFPM0_20620 [Pseudonocardia sulfidoxydans]|uniref:hypothetical protein n=1 Tax=Pseudonocardia sulfidoxydans TaxID=54011 RepID=UPI003618196A